MKLYNVPFLPGDDSDEILLKVLYIAGGFPRDEDSRCAFCHGDPCAETSKKSSQIAKYFKRNKDAETCPCCEGRAS